MPAWPRPEPPAPIPRHDHAAAQQALHIVIGGLIVFLLGAGALAAAAVNHRSTNASSPVAAESVSAGPVRGTPVDRYIADRTAELGTARGRVTAIVSFRAYMPDVNAAATVRGVHVNRWLVAAPGGEPKETTDVKGWRESTIRAVTGEIADFEQILPTLDKDPDFEQQTRRDLDADRRILAGLQNSAPVVFGIVVDGDARAIRALARAATIRLVDLAPREVARGGSATGIRPEETVAAGDPTARPA